MATFRYDPYLWVHLAGLATVPLWLAICGLGLAVGSPSAPWLEQGMIGLIGVLPILLMQWRRPFCIFSLMALALKPTAMTEDQRRILSLFRQRWVSLVALLVPIPLLWLLLQIYPVAVVAADLTPFLGWGRSGGLAVAGGSFLMANLFAQVPASVLAVMATPAQKFASTAPYPLEQIQSDFTQIGLPVRQILPEVLPPGETKKLGETEKPRALADLPINSGAAIDLEASHADPLPTAAVVHPEMFQAEVIHPEGMHPEVLQPEMIHPETDHGLVAFSASAPDWDHPTTEPEETFKPEPQPVEIAAVRISDPKPLSNPDTDARTE